MAWRTWFERLQLERLQRRSTATAPVAAPPGPTTVSAPPRPALPALGLAMALLSDEHGEDACVGCGLCATLCPTQAISVRPGPIGPSPTTGAPRGWAAGFVLDADACIACELCTQVCPADALRLVRTAGAPPRGPQDQASLRAAGRSAPPTRRRSPLGALPGAAPPPPRLPPRAAPRPRPAVDLGGPVRPSAARGPLRPPPPHWSEQITNEPTRLETWAHPIDAPTDPETDDVEACQLEEQTGDAVTVDAETGEDPTGSFDEEGQRSATRAILEGLPDPGHWDPSPDHPTDIDTLPVRPLQGGEPEVTAAVPAVRPPPPRK